MTRWWIYFLLFVLFAGSAFAKITLSGALRNDMIFTLATNDVAGLNNTLETKLILQRKAESWRFYADVRAFAYVGSLTNVYGPLRLDIVRAFGRLYTDAGDITFGQQYINFGNPGLFNPFEMDKNINLSDTSYDKTGLLALSWDIIFSDLAGAVIYVKPEAALSNSGGGLALKLHAGSFDIGLIYNRKGWNQNVAGVYFKGDLEVGINGAYAYHINDFAGDPFHELSVGMDYSFFAGRLYVGVEAYYTDRGASTIGEYMPLITDDRFFQAHTYMSSTVNIIATEFLSLGIESFHNLVDGSMILLPGVKATIVNGFTFSGILSVITGTGDDEFSRDVYGPVGLILRAELKL